MKVKALVNGEWKWLGPSKNDDCEELGETILDEFELTNYMDLAYEFEYEDIKLIMPVNYNYVAPIEAYQYFDIREKKKYEFRRNPYKLRLGVVEFIGKELEWMLE